MQRPTGLLLLLLAALGPSSATYGVDGRIADSSSRRPAVAIASISSSNSYLAAEGKPIRTVRYSQHARALQYDPMRKLGIQVF